MSGLYNGYYKGKWEDMPPPILKEIPRVHYDPKSEKTEKRTVLINDGTYGSFYPMPETYINTLNGMCIVTEFAPGQPWSWTFQCDEFHYILQGKAKMTYSVGGTFHTERKTMDIEEGDIYLIPLGARIEWHIDPKYGPLRALNIIMPGQPENKYGESIE